MLAVAEEKKTGFAVADFVRPPELHMIPFTMPKLTVGQIVNWYPNCNHTAKPLPTVVVEVHPRHAMLAACGSGYQVSPYGVRHAADPMTQKPVERSSGCWDYTDEFKQREAENEANRITLGAVISRLDHLSLCLGTIAGDLQVTLPARSEPEVVGKIETPVPDDPLSPEEIAQKEADLEAALNSDAGELATENESTKRRRK